MSLYFAEGWFKEENSRRYDIDLEGRTVLQDFEPLSAGFAVAHRKQFETHLDDGALDLDFRPRLDRPEIHGILIERLSGDD